MALFQKKGACVIGVAVIALMIIASFADMAISNSLFNL